MAVARLRKIGGAGGQTFEESFKRFKYNTLAAAYNLLMDEADSYRRGDPGTVDLERAEACETTAQGILQELGKKD